MLFSSFHIWDFYLAGIAKALMASQCLLVLFNTEIWPVKDVIKKAQHSQEIMITCEAKKLNSDMTVHHLFLNFQQQNNFGKHLGFMFVWFCWKKSALRLLHEIKPKDVTFISTKAFSSNHLFSKNNAGSAEQTTNIFIFYTWIFGQ